MDTAFQSLQTRFEQLKSNHNIFWFLISFKSLQFDDIQTFAESLEQALMSSKDHSADICGQELAGEGESLRHGLPDTAKTPEEILTYLSINERYTTFPNHFIALIVF